MPTDVNRVNAKSRYFRGAPQHDPRRTPDEPSAMPARQLRPPVKFGAEVLDCRELAAPG